VSCGIIIIIIIIRGFIVLQTQLQHTVRYETKYLEYSALKRRRMVSLIYRNKTWTEKRYSSEETVRWIIRVVKWRKVIKNSNWSKKFDIRSRRRHTRTVQSYSPSGANVHPIYRKPKKWLPRQRPSAPLDSHLTHDSLGPSKPTTQTAPRSVQPFMQGSCDRPTDRQTDRQTTLLGR